MPGSALNARKKEKKGKLSAALSGLSLVTAVVISDQLTKALISKYIPLNQSVTVIKPFLSLTLVHNTGAAFGILKNQTLFFIIISLIALPAIFYSFSSGAAKGSVLTRAGLYLVSGGAIGNLIDRLAWGHVIDFLDLGFWPVFNLADSAITVGAVLLGISMLKKKG